MQTSTNGFNRNTKAEVVRAALAQDPRFAKILLELRDHLPHTLTQRAETFEEWVLDAVMDELKATIEHIDAAALANALLSNKVLQQKLAVPLNGIASGFSERLKAEIQQQITNETQQIHNLLAARRAKERADRLNQLKRRDDLKMQREIAFAQGELLWLRISSLSVAVPSLLIAMCLGALVGLNYPVNVLCHKGDQICQLRWGRVVER
jgi:hypothetical protein